MKNKDFDVDIKIEINVLPRAYPEVGENVFWHNIESKMKIHARMLESGLEKYFESLVKEEMHYE